ncbi:hypothetical protein ACG04Q_10735 [Roseateles sp. DXS20W]|uniref:Hemerythrin-like domain-containing protein n=1 Tax=Pelomonas lactea TaxID=3299030 RepID=A0ABW7GJF7_9BURK
MTHLLTARHKGLVACVAQALVHLGSEGLLHPHDREQALAAVEEALTEVVGHVESENQLLHNPGPPPAPGAAHLRHDTLLEECRIIRFSIAAIRASTQQNWPRVADVLYNSLAKLLSMLVTHTLEEQRQLRYAGVSVEAAAAADKNPADIRLAKDAVARNAGQALRWMASACNLKEIAYVLQLIAAYGTRDDYRAAAEIIRALSIPRRWEQISASLPQFADTIPADLGASPPMRA